MANTTQPGYQTEIQNDPLYQPTVTALNAGLQGGRNTLRDTIRQLVVNSGVDVSPHLAELQGYANTLQGIDESVLPEGVAYRPLGQELSDYLDPTTLAAAQTNPLSTMAGLQNALNQGRQSLRYSLAARGLLNSGANASGQSVLQSNYDVGSTGALQTLLGKIREALGTDVGTEQTAFGAYNTGIGSIAARLAALQGPTYADGGDTTTTGTDGGTTATAGVDTTPVDTTPVAPGYAPGVPKTVPGGAVAVPGTIGSGIGASGSGDYSMAIPKVTPLKWGGKTFYNKADFSSHLKSIGQNYNAWAAAHPGAAALFK